MPPGCLMLKTHGQGIHFSRQKNSSAFLTVSFFVFVLVSANLHLVCSKVVIVSCGSRSRISANVSKLPNSGKVSLTKKPNIPTLFVQQRGPILLPDLASIVHAWSCSSIGSISAPLNTTPRPVSTPIYPNPSSSSSVAVSSRTLVQSDSDVSSIVTTTTTGLLLCVRRWGEKLLA